MKVFTLIIRDSSRELILDDVVSFRGRDASGSFSLRARHADFLTLTEPGLSQLIRVSGTAFLAATAALLEFDTGKLLISTRRFFLEADADMTQRRLADWLAAEQERRRSSRLHLQKLENELMRRLSRAAR